jgi:hypothetical protein
MYVSRFSQAADKTVTVAMFSFPFLSFPLSAAEILQTQTQSQRRFRANTNTSDETEGSASVVDLAGGLLLALETLGNRPWWPQSVLSSRTRVAG